MIPKIIHYCWFGKGEKSELELRCIESWKLKLIERGGYTLKEWNEDNFPIKLFPFTMQAYEAKKWAFVADYVRIWALYNYGGVYLDTDYEVFKDITPLLNYGAFLGMEGNDAVGTAIIGMEKGFSFAKIILDYYNSHSFKLEDGKYDMVPNTYVFMDLLKSSGGDTKCDTEFNGLFIADRKYFYPCDRNENTVAYGRHYYRGSWWSERERKRAKSNVYRLFIRPILLTTKKCIKTIIGAEYTRKLENKIKNKRK